MSSAVARDHAVPFIALDIGGANIKVCAQLRPGARDPVRGVEAA